MGVTTEAQKRASMKYQRRMIRQVNLKLNRGTDADLIAHLEKVDNVQEYIKDLIRQDMRGE